MTLAAPIGTGRTVVVPTTSRAATVRAPPPGPPEGCMTYTWYHSAPLIDVHATVRSWPLSVAWLTLGAVAGLAGTAAVKSFDVLHGPQPA